MTNALENYDDFTPISMLTVGQLKELMMASFVDSSPDKHSTTKDYVYGLDGICQLFHCKISKAQKLKNTIIKEAVHQDGRKIIVDVEHALKLFEQRTSNKRRR